MLDYYVYTNKIIDQSNQFKIIDVYDITFLNLCDKLYKKLVLLLHPDKNNINNDTEQIKIINKCNKTHDYRNMFIIGYDMNINLINDIYNHIYFDKYIDQFNLEIINIKQSDNYNFDLLDNENDIMKVLATYGTNNKLYTLKSTVSLEMKLAVAESKNKLLIQQIADNELNIKSLKLEIKIIKLETENKSLI